MQKIKAFGDWLTKWFTVIVIVWAVFNYFVPQTSLWGKSYTGYFLGIVLFGMGLTLTLDDFKRILTQPLMVVVGTVAHFVIMPLVAVLLCWIFRLDGPLAVGVILVGCCPSGTSSNVMSYLSRGDVALDVSIGILSTLCAPFMIPLLMQWLASQYVTVPVESLFLNAVKVVLFPIALGVICHAIFKEKIEKVTVALPILTSRLFAFRIFFPSTKSSSSFALASNFRYAFPSSLQYSLRKIFSLPSAGLIFSFQIVPSTTASSGLSPGCSTTTRSSTSGIMYSRLDRKGAISVTVSSLSG